MGFFDWNNLSSDNRQSTAGPPSVQNTRHVDGSPAGRRREGNQAFGGGIASAFAYFHVKDEASFSFADNMAAPHHGTGFTRGRGNTRGTFTYNAIRSGRGGPPFRGPTNEVEVKEETGETRKR